MEAPHQEDVERTQKRKYRDKRMITLKSNEARQLNACVPNTPRLLLSTQVANPLQLTNQLCESKTR